MNTAASPTLHVIFGPSGAGKSTYGAELARRERAYRGDRPHPDIRGRTVIVVDDGKPTGVVTRQDVLGYLSQ